MPASCVGGLLDQDAKDGGSATASYSDLDTSGITNTAQGAGLPAGFDPGVWGSNPAINGGLPYLLANPPQ